MTGKDLHIEPSPALRLVSLAQDLSLKNPVSAEEISAIITEICSDPSESATLVVAASRLNDPDIPLILSQMLSNHAIEAEGREALSSNLDLVMGSWLQRLTAAASLFAAGALAAGTLPFWLLAAAASAGIFTAFGRLVVRQRGDKARRSARKAANLAKAVMDARQK